MGLFRSTSKKTTEQQITEAYGAADRRRAEEVANARRNAALKAEAQRRQREWDAHVWDRRAKCPSSDHSLCISH